MSHSCRWENSSIPRQSPRNRSDGSEIYNTSLLRIIGKTLFVKDMIGQVTNHRHNSAHLSFPSRVH